METGNRMCSCHEFRCYIRKHYAKNVRVCNVVKKNNNKSVGLVYYDEYNTKGNSNTCEIKKEFEVN